MKVYITIENGIELRVEEEFCDKYKCQKTQFWRKDSKLHHRELGPAIIYSDGFLGYMINGEYHREDGPAIICPTFGNSYYLNDVKYDNIKSDEEWISFIKLKIFQ